MCLQKASGPAAGLLTIRGVVAPGEGGAGVLNLVWHGSDIAAATEFQSDSVEEPEASEWVGNDRKSVKWG